MFALMENRMITHGNLGYLQLINFYLSVLLKPIQVAKLKKEAKSEKRNYDTDRASQHSLETRKLQQMKAQAVDAGVQFLKDPYLAEFSLVDFPRLRDFLSIHLKTKPAICHERVEILTQWFKENGFEKDKKANRGWSNFGRPGHSNI